jgi:predicted N-acetyltransferase YhbS
MNIRESNKNDLNSIRLVHENAFGEPEGKVVAQLACDIMNDETAKPLLSLVVENNDAIIGHIIFSSVNIESSDELSAYILAPLAVSKKCQKTGLGTKLINHGLATLKAREADIVLVLGDPNYYKRAGFKADHSVEAPYKLEYPEGWMALELKSGMLAKAKGVAQCAFSLNFPEHW